MTSRTTTLEVLGPWSLETSKRFWEGFAPAALPADRDSGRLRSVFRVERDGSRAEVSVAQHEHLADVTVSGPGEREAAATQAARFLSLDVDARAWPAVAERDPVIADAQERLPGLRPCGFHSPYEAAAWAVLSQRVRIVQAARLRQDLVDRHGDDGAFPAPVVLRTLALDLPGRKAEYLREVADAALEGRLDGETLRALDNEQAVAAVREVKGLRPFAAELVVLRGANSPDAVPRHEKGLDAEIAERYGPDHTIEEVSDAWRPFRTWAVVHLRALREELRLAQYGEPDVLEVVDAPEPHPGTGQVRIRVHAAGVNAIDSKIRAGYMREMMQIALPSGTGRDAAGVIDEVGDGVSDVEVGEAVFGNGTDTFAEYAVLNSWARKPDSLSFAEASGFPVPVETGLSTSWTRSASSPARRCWSAARRAAWGRP